MRCDEAREAMLEAGPAELRGGSGSPLARHIARCGHCAGAAATLLDGLDALAGDMAAYGEAGDATVAADRALAAVGAPSTAPAVARGPEAPGAIAGRRTRAGRPSSSGWWKAWLPLAAAAALVGVFLVAEGGGGPPASPVPDEPPTRPGVAVTPPAGRSVAVVQTANPKITIIWQYEEES